MSKMILLRRLLGQKRASLQVVSASIGAFIGLFLLLMALQLGRDFDQMLEGSPHDDNFVTINKKVKLANTLVGQSGFSESERMDMAAQPFVQGVAPFLANRFQVSASSPYINFYTQLFFESVPLDYVDVEQADFQWFEGDAVIPIILSKDYLALYNFGFAPSQGLPQFTPATVKQVVFDIGIRGRGQEKMFKGRILGFSDRVNSILVPENFMKWANKNLGDQPDKGTARLLLKVKNPYDKDLARYLDDKGFELSTGRLVGGRMGAILTAALWSLMAVGGLLMLLSLLIFILNYQLMIAHLAADMRLLLQIGYRAADIGRVLRGALWQQLAAVYLSVVVALIAARYAWVQWFQKQDIDLNPFFDVSVCAVALGLMAAIVWINMWNIKKQILKQA